MRLVEILLCEKLSLSSSSELASVTLCLNLWLTPRMWLWFLLDPKWTGGGCVEAKWSLAWVTGALTLASCNLCKPVVTSFIEEHTIRLRFSRAVSTAKVRSRGALLCSVNDDPSLLCCCCRCWGCCGCCACCGGCCVFSWMETVGPVGKADWTGWNYFLWKPITPSHRNADLYTRFGYAIRSAARSLRNFNVWTLIVIFFPRASAWHCYHSVR